MRARHDVVLAAIVGAALTVACAKGKAKPDTAAPSPPPDDIDAIEAHLSDNAEQLRAAGIVAEDDGDEDRARADDEVRQQFKQAPSRDATEGAPTGLRTKSKEGSRCDRICDLAASTCELRDHICGLASSHAGDARYTRACTRATDQCENASAYCNRCG